MRAREERAGYGAQFPGPIYCDASALLKLYLPEPGSRALNEILAGRRDVLVSDLAVTEVVSAFARRVREGAVPGSIARRIRDAILAHVDDRVYGRLELTRDVHRQAEQLLVTLTRIPLRAADALHLALAASARAATMASFDARLSAAARAVGLTTYPITLTTE